MHPDTYRGLPGDVQDSIRDQWRADPTVPVGTVVADGKPMPVVQFVQERRLAARRAARKRERQNRRNGRRQHRR